MFISLGIGFGAYRFFSGGIVEHLLSYGAYPILILHNRVIHPLTTWIQKKQSFKLLEAQLENKHKEYDDLLAEVIELRAQLSYMQDIKELSEFKQRYHLEQAHIAQVLVHQLSEREHSLSINIGSQRGIEPGMAVVHNNCLIGKVCQVYPWYSKVVLITDRTCKVAALCAKTKAQGITAGKNSENNLNLKYVSHLAQIEQNDLVLSSGEGMVFPQGFALGKVSDIQQDGLYQRVAVAPICDVREIRYCMVLPKGFTNKEPDLTADNESKTPLQSPKNEQIVT